MFDLISQSISLKFIFIISFVLICSIILIKLIQNNGARKSGFENSGKRIPGLRSRRVLTESEVEMYSLLTKAFPNKKVLPQVSMNSIITTQEIKVRNSFSRRSVDFVYVDAQFMPILIVELDDRSHKYRVDDDKKRDTLINSANIPVLRFSVIPSLKELRKQLSPFFK